MLHVHQDDGLTEASASLIVEYLAAVCERVQRPGAVVLLLQAMEAAVAAAAAVSPGSIGGRQIGTAQPLSPATRADTKLPESSQQLQQQQLLTGVNAAISRMATLNPPACRRAAQVALLGLAAAALRPGPDAGPVEAISLLVGCLPVIGGGGGGLLQQQPQSLGRHMDALDDVRLLFQQLQMGGSSGVNYAGGGRFIEWAAKCLAVEHAPSSPTAAYSPSGRAHPAEHPSGSLQAWVESLMRQAEGNGSNACSGGGISCSQSLAESQLWAMALLSPRMGQPQLEVLLSALRVSADPAAECPPAPGDGPPMPEGSPTSAAAASAKGAAGGGAVPVGLLGTGTLPAGFSSPSPSSSFPPCSSSSALLLASGLLDALSLSLMMGRQSHSGSGQRIERFDANSARIAEVLAALLPDLLRNQVLGSLSSFLQEVPAPPFHQVLRNPTAVTVTTSASAGVAALQETTTIRTLPVYRYTEEAVGGKGAHLMTLASSLYALATRLHPAAHSGRNDIPAAYRRLVAAIVSSAGHACRAGPVQLLMDALSLPSVTVSSAGDSRKTTTIPPPPPLADITFLPRLASSASYPLSITRQVRLLGITRVVCMVLMAAEDPAVAAAEDLPAASAAENPAIAASEDPALAAAEGPVGADSEEDVPWRSYEADGPELHIWAKDALLSICDWEPGSCGLGGGGGGGGEGGAAGGLSRSELVACFLGARAAARRLLLEAAAVCGGGGGGSGEGPPLGIRPTLHVLER